MQVLLDVSLVEARQCNGSRCHGYVCIASLYMFAHNACLYDIMQHAATSSARSACLLRRAVHWPKSLIILLTQQLLIGVWAVQVTRVEQCDS
jgi:hypothetical protein